MKNEYLESLMKLVLKQDFTTKTQADEDKRFDFMCQLVDKIHYIIFVNLRPHCSTLRIIELTLEIELLPKDIISSKKIWEFWILSFDFNKLNKMIKSNNTDLINHKTFKYIGLIFENHTKLEPNETFLITSEKKPITIFGGDCDVYGSRYKEGHTKLLNKIGQIK